MFLGSNAAFREVCVRLKMDFGAFDLDLLNDVLAPAATAGSESS